MQITLETQPFAALDTEALVSWVFEETDPVQGRIAEIDQAAAGLPRKLAKSGELTGKMLEFTLLHAPAGLKAARLLLVGARNPASPWKSSTKRKSPTSRWARFSASPKAVPSRPASWLLPTRPRI